MFNAMASILPPAPRPESARVKLLDAAMDVIRGKGYHATSVDELCAAAGVTKGAFFHHFESKQALAVAAAEHWSATTSALFAAAPYHALPDPLERIFAYIDFRAALIDGPIAAFTCLAGTMAQETYASNPAIRDACNAAIMGHARTLEADIDAAIARYGIADGVSAPALAQHMQAVLQGGFVLAKAAGDPARAIESIGHLRRYVAFLFGSPERASPNQG